jgi:phosphodiester glycosidase
MSRTVPGGARQDWPGDDGRDQWYGEGQDVAGSGYGHAGQGYDGLAYLGQGFGDQGYGWQAHQDQAHQDQGYGGRGYTGQGYTGQGYDGQGYDGQGYDGQGYTGQGYDGQGYTGQGYDGRGYDGQGYTGQGYNGQGYDDRGYGDQRAGWGYQGQGQGQDGGQPGSAPPGHRRGWRSREQGQRKVRFRRLRRFARRPTVRVVGALFGIFLVWVMFSAGQAAFKNNGQGFSANLAEWARDHYLGPVVTFGEWLTYQPPKVGGKPGFSYAVPKGERINATRPNGKHHHMGFVPDIPRTVKTLASGPPLRGEGQWRVVEKVKGQPALLITFLRDGGQYTSYSNGIASFDQRLVKFSLRPGTEDPGSANWGVPDYIPPAHRTGLLATFNGGFKLDSAGGGFYLNGIYHGSLVSGAASIVYYKNGTIKIGEWGRDFHMNSKIEGVRQNLKLLVDRGKVSPEANSQVNTPAWGATLGGGYWVWRSGIGITKNGRIVFVYGQALDAQDLAKLLQRAGAVEGMQMDINPSWMKFDYYKADGHPSDPTPTPLLPTQQPSPYSYYTPSTRDFTAVYAR